MTHHSEDFKLSAVKLYLKFKSIRKVSNLLNCKKSTLHRWIERYFEIGNIKRKINKQKNSIITNQILEYIKKLIIKNPTVILSKIKKKIKKKYNITISISYLFYIIKYKLNYTNKRLRKKYYPKKKLQTLNIDKLLFYEKLVEYGKKNIISIDETGFYLNMTKHNGRCLKGKRCYKTTYIYPYVKYNFICAFKYGKIIGFKLYPKQKGGIDKNKFNDFYNKYIKNKYKDHLIILDNAKFHKAKEVVDNIEKDNKIIYSIPYNPQCNPIENLFSQLKSHIKNYSPDTYDELKKKVKYIFKKKIKKEHLKNYFKYLFIQATDFITKN
jgi:transposase-like protein